MTDATLTPGESLSRPVCTLILAWRVFDDAPIAVAANRDELLARPSRPPGAFATDPLVVAPRDERAGGTWVGYNEHGLLVAVTNRRTDIEGERSRGLLVGDALARESVADALSHVESELAARTYAGFNLVLADANEALLLEWDGVLRRTELDPGVHVVVNDGLDDASEKGAAIRTAAAPGTGEDARAWLERAKTVLADHEIPACVHADEYGTKSSSLIVVDADGDGAYWFAPGPPCETTYERVHLGEGQI